MKEYEGASFILFRPTAAGTRAQVAKGSSIRLRRVNRQAPPPAVGTGKIELKSIRRLKACATLLPALMNAECEGEARAACVEDNVVVSANARAEQIRIFVT